MKIHRFFVEYKINGDQVIVSDEEFFNQARNVLRLNIGEKIVLCDEAGIDVLSEIKEFRDKQVLLNKVSVTPNTNEPKNKITLYCSILKHDNFEVVAQKAVEVGATNIVPIICARTVKTNVRPERLKKIVKEAAEQSGRAIIPAIMDTVTFEEATKAARANDINIILNVGGQELLSLKEEGISLGIFIGPEGGWEEKEVKMAEEANFKVFSLGKLVLRAETASIIATYLCVK